MARILFINTTQREFLNAAQAQLRFSKVQLAAYIGCHIRTLSDWRRQKTRMSLDAYHKLRWANPDAKIRIIPEYAHTVSAGALGFKRRVELYGYKNFGTPEGRSKGGRTTAQRMRENPEYARRLGFVLRNKIRTPEKGLELAEFCGICLGDGHIGKNQLFVYLGRFADAVYAGYVRQLGFRLFHSPTSLRYLSNVIIVGMAGKNLIEYLHQIGMVSGNKVEHQVDAPDWIKQNLDFAAMCVRGLVDTDGCFYVDHHRYKNKVYANAGLNFSSRSLPLLAFVKTTMERLGLRPTQNTKYSVCLRIWPDILKYFCLVGTSNQKIAEKLIVFLGSRRSRIVDHSSALEMHHAP